MAHVNGESAKRELDTLVDFSANPETQSFSGDLYYEKTVDKAAGFITWI